MKFGKNNEKYKKAVKNFIRSLAGYSILCYILEIKDRNNGNILIDDEGYLIHIDFEFILSHSPGNMNFEKAPFKFTSEYLELLEGMDSIIFTEFKDLFFKSFMSLRKNFNLIISFIEIYMMINSDLECFARKEGVFDNMKIKFMIDLPDMEESAIKEFTDGLITQALDNWRTKLYDNYQKYCVGIN
jgi:phosphatidylinositol 4-kinase